MPIPTTITDLSTTPGSNYPQSTDTAGAAVYQLPQNIAAIIRKQFSAGSDVTVSASGTVTLPSDYSYITIQGTGFSISGFADCYNGREVTLRFASAGLTLTHSASFALPGSANITTTANDIAVFVNESSGVWRCVSYTSSETGITTTTLNATTSVTTPKVETSQGADVASAATVNLETATGQYVNITGTTTITAITLSQGHWRIVKFSGALTLTHSSSLILPGAANITTAAGDTAIFVGESGGVVRCVSYQVASASVDKFKVGSFTKTLTDATGGTTVISGLGFKPKMIRFFIGSLTAGFTKYYGGFCSTNFYIGPVPTASSNTPAASSSILLETGTGFYQEGTVSAVTNDSFTITWTKSGTPPGSAVVWYEVLG